MIVISICILLYVGFGVYMSVYQERLIYHPNSQNFFSCPALQDAQAVTHQGTRMYVHRLDLEVVVVYHGNAGSACDRALYADLIRQAGYGYVLVEYAGYSNDPRQTTHELIKQDVKNVLAYLETNEVDDVTVFGESIGSGAASYHASIAPVDKLLLIAPFTDLLVLARNNFWMYPTSLMVDNAFDNRRNLADYRGEFAIIHGTEDRVIPYRLGRKLFESLKANKYFAAIPGAGHNDLFMYDQTYMEIKTFLQGK